MALPTTNGYQVGDGNVNEPVLFNQAAPTSLTNTTTLTSAQISTGVILATPTAAATYTLPTGATFSSEISLTKVGAALDLYIVNKSSSYDISVIGSTGFTVDGTTITVPASTSVQIRIRRTGNGTWAAYRAAGGASSGAAASTVGDAQFGSVIRAAVAAYKRGLRTRPPIILGIGDSNFVGDGAGTGATHYVAAFDKGPMFQIPTTAPTLSSLPVATTSWLGEGNMSSSAFAVTVTQFNPKLVLGSGWSRDSATFGLGGFWMLGGPLTGGYLQYSFGSSVNNIEIYTRTSTTDSSSVGVYNSANTLITSFTCVAGAPGVQKVTVSSASFTDGIVKLKNNGGSNFRLAGMLAWNSLIPSIIIMNAGFCAADTADYAVTTFAWDGMAFYSVIDPDLTIVSLTINDILGATARATYATNLDYILTRCNDSGDLIVSTGGNGSGVGWTDGTSVGIAAEAKLAAAKYGAPFVNMQTEWVSWAATNAIGYEFDANHRTAIGYADQARVYATLLSSMLYD